MGRIILPDENRLVKQLRERDSDALREFYGYYAGYMSAIVSRYVLDNDAIKDILQNIFVKILKNLNHFVFLGAGSLQAWIGRIATNESIEYLRQKNRERWVALDWDVPDEPEQEDPLIDDIPSDLILQLIRELPTKYRTVFNLYVFEGKSHKEIADILGIKADSSASNLHRAKNLLALKISQYNKGIKSAL